MIDAKVISAIKFRLGLLQKYSCCGGFYWDQEQGKFRVSEGYYYYPWYMSYFGGHFFQFLMACLLYGKIFGKELPEENIPESSERDSLFTIRVITGLIFWFAVSLTLAVGSMMIEKRGEMVTLLNEAFMLDAKFEQNLVKGRRIELDPDSMKVINRLGIIIQFACYFPLVLPLVFGASLFHPMDPVHALLVEIFEMEVRPSIPILLVMLVEMYGVFSVTGIIVSTIILVLVTILFLTTWFSMTTPIETDVRGMGQRGNGGFITSGIGRLSENDLAWEYRCLQLFTELSNVVVAKRRVAYHAAATLIIMVLAMFGIVKFHTHVLTKSVSALGFIFVWAIILTILAIFVECAMIEMVSGQCEEFIKSVLKSTTRKTAINKTFRSFTLITLRTGYPVFSMNRSAFLEWMNIGMDNLVNLLVTFE